MLAINDALSVDLTGQIASENLGPRMLGGSGGQTAFVIGALLSKGGHSITVLPSTGVNDAVSRIVVANPAGTAITVPRNCADIIVTEYGIASVRGNRCGGERKSSLKLLTQRFDLNLGRRQKSFIGLSRMELSKPRKGKAKDLSKREMVLGQGLLLGGYPATATLLGKPDVSLLSMTEMVEYTRRICGAVDVP